jgi:hypothetical protein
MHLMNENFAAVHRATLAANYADLSSDTFVVNRYTHMHIFIRVFKGKKEAEILYIYREVMTLKIIITVSRRDDDARLACVISLMRRESGFDGSSGRE